MIGVAMNAKSTLALVVLAAAAGLWFFKGDSWGPSVGLEPAHQEPPKSHAISVLDKLTPALIQRVEVDFPSGDPLVLERAPTDSGWKLPGNWPLRKPEVQELVDTLGSLHTRFYATPVPEGADLALFGLGTGQKPVVVKLTANNQLLTLTFGEPKGVPGETAFSQPAYLRINDVPEIVKLGPDVMPVIRRSADAYRRRSLLSTERVKFAGSAPSPSSFTPPGDEAPVTMTLPGEQTVAIQVSRTIPRIWNLDLSPAFTFTLVRTGRLPEPAIFTKGGEPVLQPERLADAWALDAPARSSAEPSRLRGVLAAVADLWADSFADADSLDVRLATARLIPMPLDQFAGVVRFCPLPVDVRTGLVSATERVTVRQKGSEPVTVRFGGIARVAEREEMISVPGGPPGTPPRTIPNTVYTIYRFARVDGNPQVFTVSAEKLPDLFAAVTDLVDSQVARFARDEVREIVVQPTGGPEIRLTLTRGNPRADKAGEREDRWFLDAKPNPLLADTARVNELLDQLSGFRASGPDRTRYPSESLQAATRITVVTRDKRPEGEPDGPAREVTFVIGKPDFARRQLPVQRAGWPRVTLVDNTSGPEDTSAWVSTLLFPNTVSDSLNRPALAYRNRKLFDAAADLTTVTVAGRFALKNDAGAWKLTAPIASEADPGKAGELATSLKSLGATDYLAENPKPEDLKSFGLDAPAHTVRLDFGGRTYTLELGATRPGKPEVFARLDRGAVFGLPNTIEEQLTTGVVGLLPLKVWTAPLETITAVEVTRSAVPGESFKLVKDGADWRLSGPFTAPVPSANVQPLLATFGNLTAVKYQTLSVANPAEFGLDKPLVTVKLTHTEKRPPANRETPVTSTVMIGGVSPDGAGRYARLDTPNAPVFILPGTFVAAAGMPPLDLLDRTLLSLDARRINRVQVAPVNGTEAFTLQKGATGKWAAEGVTFTIDAERIGRLTSAAARPPVTKLAASGDAVKWADFGLDKPEATITVMLAGAQPETHTIAIGKADPLGGRYVRVDNGKAVGIVPTSTADALTRKKFEYADRTLLTFDPTTLVGLSRKQGGNVLELAPAATIGWDIVKPARQKADQPFVDELAEALGHLRAERVAAYGKKEEVFKKYGLEPPAASITLTVGDRGEQKTLRIGNAVNSVELDSDRYVAVESSSPEVIVGVLPAALVNKLLPPAVAFRDRSLAKFVDADRAVLERGDRKITFAKAGVAWKVTEPLAVAAESSELEALVADLGKLRADTWVAEKKGADLKKFGLDKPAARWTLFNGDQTVLVLLLGSKTADGRIHVTTDKGELIGLLDPVLTSRLLGEYRERKAWALDAAQVGEIAIAGPGGKFTLEKSGQAWIDPANPADAIDARVVTELLGTLGSLRVERYAVDRNADLKLFGLENPEATLTVVSAGTKHVLEVGGVVGGTNGKQRYARVVDKGRSDVFILAPNDTTRLIRPRADYRMKK